MKMEADERKKQIRQAAIKVFLDKGFRNTVMNDIMEATGLSRGGLYHHYGSTYEILYDIMMEGNLNRKDIVQKSSYDEGLILSPQLFSRMIIDKILADNDYVKLYVMFLCELKENDDLKKLYVKIKKESIQVFKELFSTLFNELPSDETFEFMINIMNSGLMACEILNARENFVKNKIYLTEMIETYFTNVMKKDDERS
ncbi:TetR/AcrR family transcriptional regulator [Peptoniphilus rhinitidis]|uniref:TetR/AcrR family transcriptional regulator n=1 Tax=Peptoniphilus rhinitidis TaxID=1175452 RepID=UPI002900D1EA|nr:TetR/AcrR family transcriptional regulator [Peptoniphilus rhinitidis]MDU1044401.1 TetR/AcrR family transcriptional regulator [Peptoniphilus rhinitidis]MDU2109814.1 TetR/AcrR family transcriptional regulator [Peptoniphilus lacydonensis]MDU3750550.1 TetR/AcrR family transcriptional regulator [Peptoniphilus rhinitidis]